MLELWLKAVESYGPLAAIFGGALAGVLWWGLGTNTELKKVYRELIPQQANSMKANADSIALIAKNQEERNRVERDMSASVGELASAVEHLTQILQIQHDNAKEARESDRTIIREALQSLREETRRLADTIATNASGHRRGAS